MMIFLTIVRYTEPNEKQWWEIEMICGNQSMVLPGRIMFNEKEAKDRAKRIADFAPDHFHFDYNAEPIIA